MQRKNQPQKYHTFCSTTSITAPYRSDFQFPFIKRMAVLFSFRCEDIKRLWPSSVSGLSTIRLTVTVMSRRVLKQSDFQCKIMQTTAVCIDYACQSAQSTLQCRVCVFRLLRNIAFNAINGEECDAGSPLSRRERSRISVLVCQSAVVQSCLADIVTTVVCVITC